MQPEFNRYVYTYFPGGGPGVDISIASDVSWDDEDYWCYVFIPDEPRIEKKITLEERVAWLESHFGKMNRSQQ